MERKQRSGLTLKQSIEIFEHDLKHDFEATCPCCRTHHKIYKRHITQSMVAGLLNLYEMAGLDSFAHYTDFMPKGKSGDFGKFKFWGYIEPLSFNSGKFRVTNAGYEFIIGATDAALYIYIYNDQALYTEGGVISIDDIVKTSHRLQAKLNAVRANSAILVQEGR